MKTTEWFACFSFGKYDILIPRDTILECRYGKLSEPDVRWNGCSLPSASLDMILKQNFGLDVPSGRDCILIIRETCEFAVVTGAVPVAVEIALSEFRPVSGIAADVLLRSGIIAFRFEQGRIQYAVDVQKLIKRAGAAK